MSANSPLRASPDALIAAAEREGRGSLRIFLGAAPGVGKTYAMLQAAKAARTDGIDVVVGLVETHGRAETEAMVAGLEVIAKKGVSYRGRWVPEFDVDAALARRPALLLVDEYAHSNVPGSRHPKRWQDVRDLLAAGIDVWTTLNIQHVESLNDVVQRITGVRVRETVPDTALEKADEIILVDLPSDELLKRLADGKIYVEDTAQRAIQSFFKPGNLRALRELALRRVAAHVDTDLLERMQGGAIPGPWAAGEKILVCVGPNPMAERVVRQAKRLADLMDAPFMAVTIERPGVAVTAAARRWLDAGMHLAESLGAETRSLVADDFPDELLRTARFENVTQIVIGQARGQGFLQRLRRNLADALTRQARGIAIHIVTTEAADVSPATRFALPPLGEIKGYGVAALCVALVTVAGQGLSGVIALPNMSMFYLIAVIIPAFRFGVWPAVFSSALAFFAYNFFFITPTLSFTVARPHEVLTLVIFFAVAAAMSALAGQTREQAKATVRLTRATRRLYEFTRRLSALPREQEVADAAVTEVHAATSRATVILLVPLTAAGKERARAVPGGALADDLAIAAAWPPEDRLDTASMTAAHWALEHDENAGANTGTLPNAPWLFVPLRVPGRRVGVLGVERDVGGEGLDSEAMVLIETLAEQTAAALARTALSTEVASARTAAETERVRNILLASISHDFRTPLASVLGAATSFLDYGDQISATGRRDLLLQMREEAEHLDGMVRNLLSMTRLEAGGLDMRRDWLDLEEAVHRAVALARKRGASQHFAVTIEPGLPLVFADQSLVDQVLANVIGNAVRYAGPAAHVELSVRADADAAEIRIDDDGPGIPAAVLPHVFEKFVRAAAGGADGGEGSGLGLAITKGIVEAHGGSVVAASPPAGKDRGASFRIRLPLTQGPSI
jgi:two-component system sensor histidine kinase KdpD